MDNFSAMCDADVTVSSDFSIGNDIVVYADDNYCRGRIMEQLARENSYKVS